MKEAVVHRRRLGHELRRLRHKSGHTSGQIAARLGWSADNLSRIERGQAPIGPDELHLLLDAHNVEGAARDTLLALRTPTGRGWSSGCDDVIEGTFAAYLTMESQAQTALTFGFGAIPGLLQHQGYARCVLDSAQAIAVATPQQVARRLELRLHRQQRLHPADSQSDSPTALRLAAVIDEAALWRAVGDPAVMESQMMHLLQRAHLPNVDIWVLPLEVARRPVFGDTFTVLQFPAAGEFGLADIAYLDVLASPDLQLGSGAQLYRKCWNAMRDQALPLAESRQFIERAAGEWRRRHKVSDPRSRRADTTADRKPVLLEEDL